MTTDEFISLMKPFSNYITVSWLDNEDKNNISLTYRMNDIDGLHCSFVIVKYDFIDNTYTLYTPHKFKYKTYYDESNNHYKVITPIDTDNKTAFSYANFKIINNPSDKIILKEVSKCVNFLKRLIIKNKMLSINNDFKK